VKEAASLVHRQVAEGLERHRQVTTASRAGVTFHVAGYSPGQEIGALYRCEVPGKITLERETNDAGLVWNGQREIIDRLILGYDPRLFRFLKLPENKTASIRKQRQKLQLHISFQTMPLQDAVDLAVLLVHATIELQRLSDGIIGTPGQFPTCGGAVDVAVITLAEGFRWLQRKPLEARAK
jgi:hypothetical protein